jgi:hypothetical protein
MPRITDRAGRPPDEREMAEIRDRLRAAARACEGGGRWEVYYLVDVRYLVDQVDRLRRVLDDVACVREPAERG